MFHAAKGRERGGKRESEKSSDTDDTEGGGGTGKHCVNSVYPIKYKLCEAITRKKKFSVTFVLRDAGQIRVFCGRTLCCMRDALSVYPN